MAFWLKLRTAMPGTHGFALLQLAPGTLSAQSAPGALFLRAALSYRYVAPDALCLERRGKEPQ